MNQKSLLFALIALTGVIVSDRATAQTFQILHQFTAVVGTNRTNTDGAFPYSLLTASGNILYGTTQVGGSGGGGISQHLGSGPEVGGSYFWPIPPSCHP